VIAADARVAVLHEINDEKQATKIILVIETLPGNSAKAARFREKPICPAGKKPKV